MLVLHQKQLNDLFSHVLTSSLKTDANLSVVKQLPVDKLLLETGMHNLLNLPKALTEILFVGYS